VAVWPPLPAPGFDFLAGNCGALSIAPIVTRQTAPADASQRGAEKVATITLITNPCPPPDPSFDRLPIAVAR